MSVQSEARKDAREYARAQQYYGDGAGTRRKLIDAKVTSKVLRDPTYARAFRQEYDKQDMGEHAMKARRERERRDASHAFQKNVKGLTTGNIQSVSPSLVLLLVTAAFAHQTGLDKIVIKKGKDTVDKVKKWNQDRKIRSTVHKITTIPRQRTE